MTLICGEQDLRRLFLPSVLPRHGFLGLIHLVERWKRHCRLTPLTRNETVPRLVMATVGSVVSSISKVHGTGVVAEGGHHFKPFC